MYTINKLERCNYRQNGYTMEQNKNENANEHANESENVNVISSSSDQESSKVKEATVIGKKGRYIAIGVAIGVLLVGLMAYLLTPSKVETTSASMREMPVSVRVSANVSALNRVIIKPTVSASVATFSVKEGDEVQVGQVLAQLDMSSVQERITAMEQSLAGLRSAQSSGSGGGNVVRSAGVGAERANALLNDGIITRKEYDAMMSRSRTTMVIGDVGGNNAGGGSDNSDQIAAVESALGQLRQQLGTSTITAPMAGRVSTIYNADRKVAIQDRPFMVIQQMSPVVASFAVPADIAKALYPLLGSAGLKITMLIDTKELPGTMTYIDAPGAASTAPTALLKATFDNPEGLALPGNFYDVIVTSDLMKETLALPSQAIRKNETGTFVYVLTADNTVDIRLVTIGSDVGGYTAITSGLQAGDEVIASKGNFELGQKVKK